MNVVGEKLIICCIILMCGILSVKSGTAPQPKQLKYFDARGAAELSRVIMHVGKMPFIDTRFSIVQTDGGKFETPEFNLAKERGELKCNMNRAPALELEGGILLGQSKAMERYLSRQCGLMGQDELSAALIDCVAEHVRDIKDKWGKVRSIGGMGSSKEKDEATKLFFTPDSGEYHLFLDKLEKSLPVGRGSGFAVGNSMSYADLCIWQLLEDTFHDAEVQPLAQAISTKFGELGKILETVKNNAALQEYLLGRPATKF